MNELAVIFKVTLINDGQNNILEFIPVDVIEGVCEIDERIFVDKSNTGYRHLIDTPENFGYCNRISIEDIRKQFPPHTPLSIIKAHLLKSTRKCRYILGQTSIEDIGIAPVIIMIDKNKETSILFDSDLLTFYYENYPSILKKYLSVETNENEVKEISKIENTSTEIDIKKLYDELTKRVINQDEPIKKILTAIWKQKGDFSDSKSRNILINGNTGVGKTEIFRIISKMLDIPCVMVSATQYSATAYVGKDVEDMLVQLIARAGGDVTKAENGILIIDEVDKLAQTEKNSSSVNQGAVQEGLLKIVEDGTYTVTYNGNKYDFNTGKLMVIAMGSWTRIELKEERTVGFGRESTKKTYKDLTKEDLVANGMLPDFIGRFSNIIQMNELDYKSLLDILNRGKMNVLALQTEFFKSKNIDLIFDEEARKAVAKKAASTKFGARALDETIETALSLASFEIATNPDIYEKLIVSEETISDNKKYTLVRRKEK